MAKHSNRSIFYLKQQRTQEKKETENTTSVQHVHQMRNPPTCPTNVFPQRVPTTNVQDGFMQPKKRHSFTCVSDGKFVCAMTMSASWQSVAANKLPLLNSNILFWPVGPMFCTMMFWLGTRDTNVYSLGHSVIKHKAACSLNTNLEYANSMPTTLIKFLNCTNACNTNLPVPIPKSYNERHALAFM